MGKLRMCPPSQRAENLGGSHTQKANFEVGPVKIFLSYTGVVPRQLVTARRFPLSKMKVELQGAA